MENTVVQTEGTTRLRQGTTPEALEGIAQLLIEIAAGMRVNQVMYLGGEIRFNNDNISTMEILSDIKFAYFENQIEKIVS